MRKTNAMRVLETHRAPYEAIEYDTRGEFHGAEEVARLIGAPPESVYKTLVVLREGGNAKELKPLLVMIAAHREVNLRLLAQNLGEKKLRTATKKEAERLTGAQIGGISALALLKRGWQVYIDRPALNLAMIHVSGGARGLDIHVAVADLIRITGAHAVQAAAEEPPQATRVPEPAP
jgi:Cys-tRNA(Pro)/Cys-tRNA(Cys) deacylase